MTGYRDAEELGAGVACVYPDADHAGQAYFGTAGSEILHGSLDEPPDGMERIAVPRLRTFNALTRANGYLWACADNGIAYLDGAGTARLLRYAPMTGMVSDVLCDHEGSIWFASARQGVMKLAESLFTDISGKSEMGERVVNTTWKKDGILYAGTDTGLVTMDEDLRVVETDISRLLSDARIRAIKEDSRGNLWFCSFHENAVVCLHPDGSMDRYNRESGLISNYARTIYECADGRMALSVSGGIQFFRDGALVETLDERSGMKNTVILSLCEDDGGTLYLGSDGDGVYEVRNGRVMPFVGENDTSSGVILMMKNDPARDVVWVITGNALACIRDGDHLALVVADVSGKGVPAALFMMLSKTLKDTAEQGLSPARVMREVNARLCDNNKNNMFVTVWLGVYEISTGTLTYADAGHEKPLLYHGGKWSFLPKHNGVALAMLEPELLELDDDPPFVDETIHLEPGDVVMQYTDGVPEATDAKEELFGDERLLSAMAASPSAEPEALLRHLRGEIDGFVREAPQFDDITMLAIRINDGTENTVKQKRGASE